MQPGGKIFISTAVLAIAACGGEQGKLQIRSTPSPLAQGSRAVPLRIAEARGQLALGNVALALESFRKARREDPNSVDALAGMAACYDLMGRYELSRRYYEGALALAPADMQLLGAFAGSLQLQGRTAEALKVRQEMAARSRPPAAQPQPQQLAEAAPVAAVPQPQPQPQLAEEAPVMAVPQPQPQPQPAARPAVPKIQPAPAPAPVEPVRLAAAPVAAAPVAAAPPQPAASPPPDKAPPIEAGPSVTIKLPPARVAAAPESVTVKLPPTPVAAAPETVTVKLPPARVAAAPASAAVELAPTRPVTNAASSATTRAARNTGPRLERLSMGEIALVTSPAPLWRSMTVARTSRSTTVRWVPLREASAQPAQVRLLNAARVNRLAARTHAWLAARGWRGMAIGDAPSTRTRSLIVYPAGQRALAQRLSNQFGFALEERSNIKVVTMLLGRDAARIEELRPERA